MHLDQFYTRADVAQKYVEFTLKRFGTDSYQYVEPSAGTGAFFQHLPVRSFGCDLEPKFTGIIEMDYFDFNSSLLDRDTPVVVIGNPPFGKNASLAVRFFNHSASFASAIAMIVPRTFRKDSLVKRLDHNFHLVHDETVESMAFVAEGEPYDVPCAFQIWEKKDHARVMIKRPTAHADFMFVTVQDADFAIQRVGVNAGRVKTNVTELSVQSHHFVKAESDKVIDIMRKLDVESVKYDTAGNPSIGKAEIVTLYERALQLDSQSI